MEDQQDTVYCVTFPLTSSEYNRIREACEISRGSSLTSNEIMEMIVSICYNELHLFTQRNWMEATERKLRRDFPDLDIHINAVMGGSCIFNFGSDPTMEERKAVSEKISEYIKEREGKNEGVNKTTEDLKPLLIEVWRHMRDSERRGDPSKDRSIEAFSSRDIYGPDHFNHRIDLTRRVHEAAGYTPGKHVIAECPLCSGWQ